MDVPVTWYKHEMQNRNLIIKLSIFTKRYFPHVYNLVKRYKEPMENVGGVKITIPQFRGFLANPDYFFKFKRFFSIVRIEVQPFACKPIIYRKFRFNIIMKNKII